MDILITVIQFILLFWFTSSILAWLGIMLIINFSDQYREYMGYTGFVVLWPSVITVLKGPWALLYVFSFALSLSLPSDEDIGEE